MAEPILLQIPVAWKKYWEAPPPPKKTKNIPQKLTKLYGSGVIPVKKLRSQFWSVEQGDGLGIDVDHQDTTLKQRPVEEFLSFFLFLPL